jgi:Transposase, Mutator family
MTGEGCKPKQHHQTCVTRRAASLGGCSRSRKCRCSSLRRQHGHSTAGVLTHAADAVCPDGRGRVGGLSMILSAGSSPAAAMSAAASTSSRIGTWVPCVVLDATYCKARVNHRVVSPAVVIATGVRAVAEVAAGARAAHLVFASAFGTERPRQNLAPSPPNTTSRTTSRPSASLRPTSFMKPRPPRLGPARRCPRHPGSLDRSSRM